MADEKQQRPTMGDYVAMAYPQTARAIRSSREDQGKAWSKGDYGRTIGASLRQVVTVPSGIVYDTVVPPAKALWNGAGSVLGGLIGSDGSTTVNRAYTPPSERPARGAQVVDAALQAGRKVADSPLTPQEKMLAHLDTLLSRPMTLRGMAAVSGALQQTTSNTPRPASAKDNVLASTAEISQATYNAQIKDIMAKRAAGTMNLEQAQAATTKATDAYFLRNTALVGNPLSFAQANMLPPAQPEE